MNKTLNKALVTLALALPLAPNTFTSAQDQDHSAKNPSKKVMIKYFSGTKDVMVAVNIFDGANVGDVRRLLKEEKGIEGEKFMLNGEVLNDSDPAARDGMYLVKARQIQ